MNEIVHRQLKELVVNGRVAALGTLRGGRPQVTMVQYAVESDLSAFYLHLSRLAHHTQNILADPRVSLMVMENAPNDDPQTWARVSILGQVAVISVEEPGHDLARQLYLSRFPREGRSFMLGDFHLYRITPESGRFVAGFGQIYNLSPKHFGLAD